MRHGEDRMNTLPQGFIGDLSRTSVPLHDRAAQDLDDDLDREELRQRYYGLLQELRVCYPVSRFWSLFFSPPRLRRDSQSSILLVAPSTE